MPEQVDLSGRRILCFLALPHHNRILLPVMEGLQRAGAEVLYTTAEAESMFEITLLEAGLDFRSCRDYWTPELAGEAERAYRAVGAEWRERFLGSPTLQALPMGIWDKNIRSAVEETFLYRRLLEVERPDAIFALHELNRWGKTLGYWSHHFGIPFVTFQEGHYYVETFHFRFHTEYSTACVVWGDETRNLLRDAGNAPDKMFSLGNVDLFPGMSARLAPSAVEATRKALGLPEDRSVVLYCMGMANYERLDAGLLERLAREGNAEVILKWHPRSGPDQRKAVEEALAPLEHVHSVQDFDTYALIAAADVCVMVGRSSTGVEALAYGKPVVEVPFPGSEPLLARTGTSELASRLDDSVGICLRLLAEGPSPERRERVEAYLDNLYTHRDAGTVDRVVAMTARMLEARRTRPGPLPAGEDPSFEASVILPVDGCSQEVLLATLLGLAEHQPGEHYELVLVDASGDPERAALLASLEGDVQVVQAEPGSSYGTCCNLGASRARGRVLAFLKPGHVPDPGWLEALLEALAEPGVGAAAGPTRGPNGLIWSLGVAFEANHTPFPLYQMLPVDLPAARRRRSFRSLYLPLATPRDLFLRVGGFDPHLAGRLEDVAYGLRLQQEGFGSLYVPEAGALRAAPSWEPRPEHEEATRAWFYASWIGSLAPDESAHLAEDGLDSRALSTLYRDTARELANRVSSQVAAGVGTG